MTAEKLRQIELDLAAQAIADKLWAERQRDDGLDKLGLYVIVRRALDLYTSPTDPKDLT